MPLVRGHDQVLKHWTANPGIARSISRPPKLLKEDNYTLVLLWKSAPMYQCYTLGTLKNLVCHVWWALQYFAQ